MESEKLAAENESLKKGNAELGQFFYSAMHDLKAPLRAITNLSQWIEADLGAPLKAELAEHLKLLRLRVKRMNHLLDDLLEYSRVGEQQDPVIAVDLAQLAEEVAETSLRRPGIKIEVQPGMPIFQAALGPLRQVLTHLVANALKHHHQPEGHVLISAVDRGDNLEISVKDDGPGIDIRHQERIFQIFQTLKPKDEVEGSGVGLALVKKILQQQGGSVRLESAPGAGSIFSVLWPKGPEPALRA